jgi:uncharacterized protein (DUF952 family)
MNTRAGPPVETQGERRDDDLQNLPADRMGGGRNRRAIRRVAGRSPRRLNPFLHRRAARGTAAKHFAGLSDLMLVAVDGDALGGALKWEPSRGGELFPHLYAVLPLSAVLWARPLADEIEGRRAFPELVS